MAARKKRSAKRAVRRIADAARKPLKAVKRTASAARRKKPATSISRMPASPELGVARTAATRLTGRKISVDEYVLSVQPPLRAILGEVRRIVRNVEPGVTESYKWGQPVYEMNGPFAWMKAFRSHVGFGFWRGADLPDPKGLLEGGGDRMRHVKLRDAGNIPRAELEAFVRAALDLNRSAGDPTRRRAGKSGTGSNFT